MVRVDMFLVLLIGEVVVVVVDIRVELGVLDGFFVILSLFKCLLMVCFFGE